MAMGSIVVVNSMPDKGHPWRTPDKIQYKNTKASPDCHRQYAMKYSPLATPRQPTGNPLAWRTKKMKCCTTLGNAAAISNRAMQDMGEDRDKDTSETRGDVHNLNGLPKETS